MHACSGAVTGFPAAICVAPTEVMYGHVLGNEGLNVPAAPRCSVAFGSAVL